jgi:heme A synthase
VDSRREHRDEEIGATERTERSTEYEDRPSMERVRARFGGLDIPASLAGMLVAIALTVLLAGIIGAIVGAIGFQRGAEDAEELSIGAFIGGLVALFLAFLIGGWAAGRMARYSGGLNGIMTAVWFLILAGILAALGAWIETEYDVFQRADLPRWFSSDARTIGAIISGILAIGVMLLGGWLGGKWGERYHRRPDAAIAAAHERGDPRVDWR